MSESPPEQSQVVYEQRAVAFVDILGFGELVRRADKTLGLQCKIIDALRRVRSVASPEKTETDLRIQNFSDSLIISARSTADGFWHLALTVDALAWSLLSLGLLVRGGITVGNVYHDDEIVFGI